jgi:hypothetical protein
MRQSLVTMRSAFFHAGHWPGCGLKGGVRAVASTREALLRHSKLFWDKKKQEYFTPIGVILEKMADGSLFSGRPSAISGSISMR